MQLVVLLLALLQTMVIHRLAYRKLTVVVIVFDRVFRFLIPSVLYPSLVLGMFFLGNHDYGPAYFFLIGGILGTVVLGWLLVHRLYFRAISNRKKAVEAARTMAADDPGYGKMIERLFHTYDIDSGGEIDNQEMRAMLTAVFASEPRAAVVAAMQEVIRISGGDEELDFESFRDAYEAAIAAVAEYKQEHAAVDGEKKTKLSYAAARALVVPDASSTGRIAVRVDGKASSSHHRRRRTKGSQGSLEQSHLERSQESTNGKR